MAEPDYLLITRVLKGNTFLVSRMRWVASEQGHEMAESKGPYVRVVVDSITAKWAKDSGLEIRE